MYELLIIGGGPAGVAAGVYAARKKIKAILITESFGGQSVTSAGIENWIGAKSISGYDLSKMLEEHLRAQGGIEIIEGDLVSAIKKTDGGFSVETKNGKKLETKFILLAAGSGRRKLGVPGEKEFEGRGVFYCSTCDAPLMKGKVAAVVGGGNAGLEAVHDLLPYAEKIYLLIRSEGMKGDPVTQEKIKASPKVEIITHALTREILGKEFITGLKYKNSQTGEETEIITEGVFVEIGAVPNSYLVKDFVKLNDRGEIIVDHKTQQTPDPGIWAVGDVTDVLYKQNNISAGDAVKAVLNVYEHLRTH